MKKLLILAALIASCIVSFRADAQIGGTLLALSQKPNKFVCVLLTGNGVQLTGGGVNLCE